MSGEGAGERVVRIPTLDDVRAAARRIAPHVHRTPVATSATLNRELEADVHFKCENLQKVGAFKARGANNAVFALDEAAACRGVITHSSGNHGGALAYAAGRRGIPCTVVMNDDAPSIKVEAVRGYGAKIVACPRKEREKICDRLIEETGQTFIHPFENPFVIAGQATAALELLEQAGQLDLVIAPVGGGGLLSGTTLWVKGTTPDAEVWGAEPETADDARRSMQTGMRQPWPDAPQTICDGLLTGLGEAAFEILRANGVEIITVGDEEVVDAGRTILQRMKLVIEPSAAIVLAALRREKDRVRGKRVGAIFSGGNTDFAWLPR